MLKWIRSKSWKYWLRVIITAFFIYALMQLPKYVELWFNSKSDIERSAMIQSVIRFNDSLSPKNDCVYLVDGELLRGEAIVYHFGNTVLVRTHSGDVDVPMTSVQKIVRRCS